MTMTTGEVQDSALAGAVQETDSPSAWSPASLRMGALVVVAPLERRVGASTIALAMAEAAHHAGLRPLLIDAAARRSSGLDSGLDQVGPRLIPGGPVRTSQRSGVVVRSCAAPHADGRVDVPAQWMSAGEAGFDVTVVDLGASAEEIFHYQRFIDSTVWLNATQGEASVVAVADCSVPGLAHAEAIAHEWSKSTLPLPTAIAALDVGSHSPLTTAGPTLAALLQTQLETFPINRDLRVDGITPQNLPRPIRDAGLALLHKSVGPELQPRIAPPKPARRGFRTKRKEHR